MQLISKTHGIAYTEFSTDLQKLLNTLEEYIFHYMQAKFSMLLFTSVLNTKKDYIVAINYWLFSIIKLYQLKWIHGLDSTWFNYEQAVTWNYVICVIDWLLYLCESQ